MWHHSRTSSLCVASLQGRAHLLWLALRAVAYMHTMEKKWDPGCRHGRPVQMYNDEYENNDMRVCGRCWKSDLVSLWGA